MEVSIDRAIAELKDRIEVQEDHGGAGAAEWIEIMKLAVKALERARA